MSTLTAKQNNFFKVILDFYNNNKIYPTINDLKKITDYKSYNTIYKYLTILEKKEYLKYDKKRHQITFINRSLKSNNQMLIPVVDNSNYLNITNNDNLKIIKVSNNSLKSFGIYLNDNLILSDNLVHLNNKFVVIERYKKYNVFKCLKKDNYYYLINDKEELVLENKNLILYKVVSLIRKL